MRSLRQLLHAAIRWNLIRENPAKEAGTNPQPRRKEVAFFASLIDADKLAVQLDPAFGPIPIFGVETALQPSECTAIERRHVDRRAGVVRDSHDRVGAALEGRARRDTETRSSASGAARGGARRLAPRGQRRCDRRRLLP